MYKMQNLKAGTDRLYVRREVGGTGFLQTEVTYKAQIVNTAEHLNTKYKEDQFVCY
jgi:hypothetical protein